MKKLLVLIAFNIFGFAALSSAQVTNTCQIDPSVADATPYIQYCFSYYTTGNIYLPAATYTIAGTLKKTRSQSLIGAGTSTIINCTSTVGPCIVSADTGLVNNQISRIQDVVLVGTGSNIGIYLGGDPNGVINSSSSKGDNTDLVNVLISGFKSGVEYGNNTSSDRILHSLIFNNTFGLNVLEFVTNSGKNMNVTDSSIFNNSSYGIQDAGDFEWMIDGTLFSNNGTAFYFQNATIHLVNCHIEQQTSQMFFQPQGNASLSIKDSELASLATSGNDAYFLGLYPKSDPLTVNEQTDNISIDNVNVVSYHPVQYFLHVEGIMNGTITNLYGNGNNNVSHLFSIPASGISVRTSVLQ